MNEFNPSSFEPRWDESGNLVVDVRGADPDGLQTVTWHYGGAYGTGGTSGSVTAPWAQEDGTATITLGSRHFGGDRSKYTVVVAQTLGPPVAVAAA